MDDLISRQAAIDRINKQREHLQPDVYPQDEIGDAAYRICSEFIDRLPSAERKKGKWEIEKALKLLSQQLIWMYDDGKISYEVCLELSGKLMDIAKMVRGEEE